ncbi:cytochrome P450 [Streptomyces sp. NPDC050803]|uniref:cytochrome P450 n=1 Tax=unclassified Streptomyces TaxID=2593676 RepID=UPI00342380CD
MTSTAAPDRGTEQAVANLLVHLATPAGRADPYPVYQALRRLGPVLPAPWGGALVTDHTHAKAVLADTSLWPVLTATWHDTHRPQWRENRALRCIADSILLAAPEDHLRHRRAMGPRFAPRAAENYRPLIRAAVHRSWDAWQRHLDHNGTADVVDLVARPVPAALLAALLGVPQQQATTWSRLGQQMVAAVDVMPSGIDLRAADTAARTLTADLDALVRKREAVPGEDLVSWCLAWNAGGLTLSRHEIVESVAALISAAGDTTTATLANIVLGLCRHPDQADWLRDHPAHIPHAVEEFLRWDPATQATMRTAARTQSLAGTSLTQGDPVQVLVGSANRDPALTPEPDALDLSREPVDHLAFAAGPHYCLGAALARVQAAEFLTAALDRLSGIELAAPPTYPRRFAVRGPAALVLARRHCPPGPGRAVRTNKRPRH